MTAVKRLIVNADDLGRTPGVNQGVVKAHREGIVSSASVMVNCPAAVEVPALARESPGLGLGLHVSLTGGRPTLPPDKVPSLVSARGLLPEKPEGLESAQPREILAEVRAQLRRFRELIGRDPTHLDSHHHAHNRPEVLEALVTLSWETGLPVRSVSPEMRARLRRERISTADHFVEEFHGETVTLESLVRILGNLWLGTTELICHPAVVDDTLRMESSYAEPRQRELAALTHVEARQVLQAAGIRLVHYGALTA